MGQLKVNVPGTAEGELIEVPPFGLIPNGSTVVLKDEDLDVYEAYMQYLSGDPDYEIEEDIAVGDPEAELPPPLPKPKEEEAPVGAVETPGPGSTEPKDGE